MRIDWHLDCFGDYNWFYDVDSLLNRVLDADVFVEVIFGNLLVLDRVIRGIVQRLKLLFALKWGRWGVHFGEFTLG